MLGSAAAASSVSALRITCDPGLSEMACQQTVHAALERGLASFHPLILSAQVAPGEAAAGQVGHRATVTFDLLGVPGPTTVRLFYDIGAHWGGVPSRTAAELAGWALLMAGFFVAAAALVVAVVMLVTRRRRADRTGGS